MFNHVLNQQCGLKIDFNKIKGIEGMKSLVISILLIIISITIYKLAKQDASLEEQRPASPALVKTDEAEQTAPKDPFKEAIENQAKRIESNQNLNKSIQRNDSKDPFKDFLDRQSKELNQSKVSRFVSVTDK